MENISNITKDFYVLYHELLISKNEDNFINNLMKFGNMYNLNEFIDILDIKKLIFHLKDIKLIMSHKILLLLYIKADLYSKLLHFDNEPTIKSNEILRIIETIQNNITFVEAFNSFPETIDQINTDDNINIENNHKNYWYIETQLEIFNRLEQLFTFFTKSFFEKYDIQLILKSDLLNSNYIKILQYYDFLLRKIKIILNKSLKLCDAYIEVEKTIVLMFLSDDISLDINLGKYNLIIEDEDSNSDTSDD